MKPRTAEQENIINEKGNCVVIAIPGSGKTFTLSEKIKTILPELPSYKGVIAISYTNKASNELKQRTLSKGVEPKNSFFGTIDKFCVIEIIIPFGKHLWGLPSEEIKVLKLTEVEEEEEDSELAEIIKKIENSSNISLEEKTLFQSLYLKGIIVLEKIGVLANVILANSKACQSYLVSRYTHIIIDEYQDSDFEQNKIFLEINRLGLCAVAVGDLNQAIFGFAGKEMKFLESLCSLENFTTFPLTCNFRCHPSIENYSKIFLKTCLAGFEPRLEETEKIKVFEKKVNGGEQEVIAWLDRAIPSCCERFGITENSKIGILVTSSKSSGKRISSGLTAPNRLIETTMLDIDVNFWSDLFSKLLSFSLNSKANPLEFLEDFIDIYDSKKSTRVLVEKLGQVKNIFQTKSQINDDFIKNAIIDFEDIARLVYPRAFSKKSLELLNTVISNEERLANYLPPRADEVQILTLHKSKGLEFDVVFHCDLYSFILPRKAKINGQWVFDDKSLQDNFNLHYVGLTRAKKCCVLLHSTQRINARGETSNADPSEFLLFEGLIDYRIVLP